MLGVYLKRIQLHEISCTRSGDKGPNSNVGIVFYNEEIYKWAVVNLTASLIKNHFKSIVKGNVLRYELPNLYALNFILEDSLGGGGSDTLVNDAQGKTYGQALMLLEVNVPENMIHYGMSKAAMTGMAQSIYRESNCPVVIIRPCTAYGPGQPSSMFISQAVNSAVGGKTFRMTHDKQRRDLVFVKDLVQALVIAATAPGINGEIINIASGKAHALRDVAKRIWELSDSKGKLIIGGRKAVNSELVDTSSSTSI